MIPWKQHLSSILSERFFSRRSVMLGEKYVREGRVLVQQLEEDADSVKITAQVQGNRRDPYAVAVQVRRTGNATYAVTGDCACMVGSNCKHVVATILAAKKGTFEQQKQVLLARMRAELAGLTGEVQRQRKEEPSLSAPLAQWLHEMRNSTRAAEQPQRTQAKKRVVFLLTLREQGGVTGAVVQLVNVNVTKSGDGRVSRLNGYYAVRDVLHQPEPSDVADVLRTMAGEYGTSAEVLLNGGFAAEMLRRIVATGKCYWKDAAGEPLRLGAARAGRAVWREMENGSQRTAFATVAGSEVIIPLAPPWYLDEATRECGPLEVEMSGAAAEQWLRAPAVDPEEAGVMAEQLKDVAVPAPKGVEVRVLRNVRPVPVLRLEEIALSQSVPVYEMGLYRTQWVNRLAVGWVGFDYDGCFVAEAAQGPREFLSRRTDRGYERILRMPRVEGSMVRMLEEMGMASADHLCNYSAPKEVKGALGMSGAQHWMDFMTDSVPQLEAAGWRVEVAANFPYRPVAVEGWYAETKAGKGGNDWFSYELGIVVEGEQVNLLPMMGEVLRLLERADAGEKKEEVQWRMADGRTVKLPAGRLREIAATLAELYDPEALAGGRLEVSRLRAAELVDLHDDVKWRGPAELIKLARQLAGFTGINAVAAPEGLRAQLRPYQSEGLSWLQFLREHEFGGILADDMGLGKTVQALAHVLEEKRSGRAKGPSLVVAPTSLMGNWRAEAARFAPELKVLLLHGGGRKEHFEKIGESDLVVTSYPLLPRDGDILRKQAYHLLILDEAQYIKNPRAKWSETARELRAAHRVCMTGTPMENHLGELWSLMHFLSPGYLGSEKQFRRIYRDPIEKRGDTGRRAALARRVRPFIMRRRKEDVLKELPPKTEIVRAVELDGGQRDLYETIRLAMQERVREEVAKKGMSRSHIVILDALLKLRQVCCDPRLVKLERARKIKESAKLEMLREMLPAMIAEGRRVLLFSQFTSMLDLIEDEVREMGIAFVRLTGETLDRETPVRQFQAGQAPLFLISLRAGGTGLNLTAADSVIHYDPWWNPAVERQATDRAHRIGQDKPVFVYKLVTTGTVEEKILAMQERKKELVAGLLGEGSQENLQLSKADIDHLFEPLG